MSSAGKGSPCRDPKAYERQKTDVLFLSFGKLWSPGAPTRTL